MWVNLFKKARWQYGFVDAGASILGECGTHRSTEKKGKYHIGGKLTHNTPPEDR
jgi:hypothetical protein